MKKIMIPTMLALLVVTSAFTLISNIGNWKVNEETYSVKFTSSKFDGVFKGLKSEINFDENNLATSKISASIDANTVNTGNGMRNKHAKQGLNANTYPTIRFESTSIRKNGSSYIANGKLTIKDVTKEIILPFTFSNKADEGVFEGSFSVKPAEYHVEKAGTPDEIQVQLLIPVTK